MEETVRKLTQWVEYESWTYCKNCHLLHPCKMLPNYGQGKLTMPKVAYVQKADIMYLWLVFLTHCTFHMSLRYN